MTALPPPKPSTATLAILCPAEETARRIETRLRNSGHPVRGAWLNDLGDFEDLLQRAAPDLAICATDLANVSTKDVVRLCLRHAPDVPTLFMSHGDCTPADTAAALAAGAADLVSLVDEDALHHLEQVCLRELKAHYLRRELRTTRARLADFESRHKNLMAGTADAVVHVQEGIITHANAAFATLLGYGSPESLHGNPLMDCVAESGVAAVKKFLKDAGQGKAPPDSRVELELRTEPGATLKVTAQVALGKQQGEHLIELLIRAEARPVKEAPGATVSGRAGLASLLDRAIKANVGMHRALMVLMVDAFASIEQRLGYQESEDVVDQFAGLVQHRLSPKEPLFRFSTALCATVLSRPNHDEFGRLAEILRQDVAEQIFKTRTHETQLSLTAICYPLSPNDEPDKVIDAAVGEVRKQSREGGNRTAVVGKTAEAAQVKEAEKRKAEQVKQALIKNRLKLAYQSIASLEGDERQHFDVLVRMLDDAGHEVPAREFVPAAEQYGVIVAIDRWVISRSLGVLSKRQGSSDQSSLFVRISEQTLREGDTFLKWFLEQTKSRPLKGGELVLAIPEAVIETHVSKAKALAVALKRAGASLAVDRFGTGTKSAQLLEVIPADFVRFDYSFSKDFDDEKVQGQLAELMKAAKAKKMKTIMGQVENATAMARLWQLGVNYIQGFHIQAPEAMPVSAEVRR